MRLSPAGISGWGVGPYEESPLSHVLQLAPLGTTALEFGVAAGASLAVIAAHMPVVGFDSFQGLPEDFGPYSKGHFACAPPAIANARLVIGLFEDTLPLFDFSAMKPIGLVHIDCDLYSSTKTVLEHVGPHLRPGCYIVFDEWHGQPWHVGHEERAWREYAGRTGVGWSGVGHGQQALGIVITG